MKRSRANAGRAKTRSVNASTGFSSVARTKLNRAFSEVVGVVTDFNYGSFEAKTPPTYFRPAGQSDPMAMAYYLRTKIDPASVAVAVQRISKEAIIGPIQPQINWAEQDLYASMATRRLLTWLLVALTALGQ